MVDFDWTPPNERQARFYHAMARRLCCLGVPDPTLTIALHELARPLEASEPPASELARA
ncbi:MAG: hypothetical protein NZ555_10180 [Geminicoccaceae bacterium]|nr:hypothetical protein [Geminicoccaceae bacterium]